MKTKINYNRWKITSKEIKSHQDFTKILKKLQNETSPFWQTFGFWGRVGVSCLFLGLLIYHF